MAVAAEMLLPKDRVVTTVMVAERCMLITSTPRMLSLPHTYVCYEDGPVLTIDPHTLAHTPGATNYGPLAFNNTIKAFDLVHRLGVEPSCQTIWTLDQVITTTSANLNRPKAGPSSLKCPCLEEHISMDAEKDTISLGDEEQPFVYKDFTDSEFDEVDAMVLDHYNAVSMNLGVEASLFRQVPSTHTLLTDTDMLPLHVRYMPALYIVSSNYNMSCRISSLAYNICSHEIHDA